MTAPSLTIAENMADLIDGYCRLVNGASQSFIIRPQKGELRFCLHLPTELLDEPPSSLELFFSVALNSNTERMAQPVSLRSCFPRAVVQLPAQGLGLNRQRERCIVRTCSECLLGDR